MLRSESVYCKILHADDLLLPTCLQKMVAVAEAHPSVGLVGSYSYWGNAIVGEGLPRDRTFFSGAEVACRSLRQEVNPFWSPSCHLHKTAAVREREFFYDEHNLHADVQSSYEILENWDFGFVHETLTSIRSHDDSRTSVLANPLKKTLATNMDLLVTYGPRFLSEEAFDAQVAAQLDHYYGKLAVSVFEWQPPRFWAFHRSSLRAVGYPLSFIRLLRYAGREFGNAPWRNFRRMARWMYKRTISRLRT